MFYRKMDGNDNILIKYDDDQDICWGRKTNINLETLDMVISMLNHHMFVESKRNDNDI